MLVAIDALTKKVAAEPLKDRLASTTAAGMKKVFQALGVPANVYSDDGLRRFLFSSSRISTRRSSASRRKVSRLVSSSS